MFHLPELIMCLHAWQAAPAIASCLMCHPSILYPYQHPFCPLSTVIYVYIPAEIPENIRLTSSLLAELIVTCLKDLSEPLVTSKLSGDLLTHLRAASEGHVKLYVVKCLLEELPDQQHGMTP